MYEMLQNKVIICDNYIKEDIISKYHFLNCKFLSLQELKEKLLFKYKSDTLLYVSNNYNLEVNNAKIILDNLYYIDYSFNKKTDNLYNIKEDLIKNNFIIFDNNFKTYLKNKEIVVLYNETKFLKKILLDYNVTFYNKKLESKELIIHEFDFIEDEIVNIASNINKLIANNININDIKVYKTDTIYDKYIEKIFSFYNIPYNLNKKVSLYSIQATHDFLNNLDESKRISDIDINNIDLLIKDRIINILNKYIDVNPYIKDFYEVLVYELKNTYRKNIKYYDCIEFIDNYKKSPYIFIIGYNNEYIPKIYKDNDYLEDFELENLGLDTSLLKTKYEKEKFLNYINSISNIYISYKKNSLKNRYAISDAIDKYNIVIENYNYDNKIINELLYAKRLDDLINYNIEASDLNDLYSNIDIDYSTYSNHFKGINIELFKEKMINKINLSYSNMDNFYKCKFYFYVNDILKLNNFEETISIKIGNFFHKVLEEYYKNGTCNIDEYLDVYFDKSNKQKFYNKKYKENIKNIINIINDQLENSKFTNTYFEEWFSINKTNDLNIKIVGKIDKIMTLSDEKNTYVSVIDYKTGFLHADFNKVIHGIDMQLLVYLYLIKNTNKIKNPIFTGMYLESILSDVLKYDEGKSYAKQISDNCKLMGYTLENKLKDFDINYDINSFIKSMKVKKDGSFYNYSKVIDNDTLNMLLEIVEKNISNVIENISNGDFKIDPKELNGKNISCEFCKNKDLCYMKNKDIEVLKEYKNLEYLGGEQ